MSINNVISEVKYTVKNWWISLLIGVLFVGLGVWCFFVPFETMVALSYLFAIAFLVGGVAEICFAISNSKQTGWGWSLAGGIIDLIFGAILVAMPLPVVTQVMIYFVGFMIMFRSIMSIGLSIELKQYKIKSWGWLLAFAILSLIFSVIFLITPVFGGLVIAIYAAIAFLFYGIFRIYLAFEFKKIGKALRIN